MEKPPQRGPTWTAATGALDGKLDTMAAQLRGEISSAVNKMLLAQLAIAGLLFAAIKVFA